MSVHTATNTTFKYWLVASILLAATGWSFPVLSAQDWELVSETGGFDGGRFGHDMSYITRNKIVMFGGDNNGALNDTYIYTISSGQWSQICYSCGPSDRLTHAMAFLAPGKVLLFGGDEFSNHNYKDDTWIYDLNTRWTSLAPTLKPSPRSEHGMATLGDDNQVVLFGGFTSEYVVSGETWVFNMAANSWTQLTPAQTPAPRANHCMASIGDGKVVLFGGQHWVSFAGWRTVDDKTWVFDSATNTWTDMNPPSNPGGLWGNSMAYIGNSQVVMTDGIRTWVYDLNSNTWTQDTDSVHPSGRGYSVMCESNFPGPGKAVLFGGDNFDPDYARDTWTFGGGDYVLLPDLVPVAGSPLADLDYVDPGGSVTVLPWIIENQGTAAAEQFSFGYYLSTDEKITRSDVELLGPGNRWVTVLATGAQLSIPSEQLTIPPGTIPGEYFIGILVNNGADDFEMEAELYNNSSSQPISVCLPNTRLYVDANASPQGLGNGISWTDAFRRLEDALAYAKCPNISEIWVAKGTYVPGISTDRTASFKLHDNLAVYGGFEGDETSFHERNWSENQTILSGDIGVQGDDTDNCYHVVTAYGTDSTAVLDGFVVTGGRSGGELLDNFGGGMFIDAGSPRVSNVTFAGNAAVDGGGMYCYLGSHPTLTNVTFTGNSAMSDGGGLFVYFGSSTTLTNVFFLDNSANSSGGGIYEQGGGSTLANVLFRDNSATVGGGMYNDNGASPTLTNVTFSANTATGVGGGMVNGASCDPTIINTVIWGNSASFGAEIYNLSGTPVISHSLIGGCGGSGVGWDPSFGTDGDFNLEDDPQFKGADFPDEPLTVWSFSPVIDSGENSAVPAGISTDIRGFPRIFDGGTVDIGAYEHPGTPTGVIDDLQPLPSKYIVHQNVPNPFNPSTTISFDLPVKAKVSLRIYDLSGRLVRVIMNGDVVDAGHRKVEWKGNDAHGRQVAAGVYFFRFEADSYSDTKRMMLVK